MFKKHRPLMVGSFAITFWYAVALWHLIPPSSIVHGHSIGAYRRWAYAHLAYSDIFALYGAHHLFDHALVYWHTPMEYPVMMGLVMWVTAWVPQAIGFFAATAGLLWICAVYTHYLLSKWSRQGSWLFSLSPLLLTFGLLNWDVMGITLMLGGVYLFRRQKWSLSAAMFALAVFFKLFPVFYLPFLTANLLHEGRKRELRRMLVSFSATAVAINLPAALANWSNWSLFFRFNASRTVSADLWNNAAWHITSVSIVNEASLIAVLLAVSIGFRQVWHGRSLYGATAATFAVFLLVNKVFSPQYMIWLLALGAAADWPIWTMIIASVAGVIDYVNSLLVLHLLTEATPARVLWYGRVIFPLGLLVRYSAIALILLGALTRGSQSRGQGASHLSSRSLPP